MRGEVIKGLYQLEDVEIGRVIICAHTTSSSIVILPLEYFVSLNTILWKLKSGLNCCSTENGDASI